MRRRVPGNWKRRVLGKRKNKGRSKPHAAATKNFMVLRKTNTDSQTLPKLGFRWKKRSLGKGGGLKKDSASEEFTVMEEVKETS